MPFLHCGTSDKSLNLLVPIFLDQQRKKKKKARLTSIPCSLSGDGQMRSGKQECSQDTVNLKTNAESMLGTIQIFRH